MADVTNFQLYGQNIRIKDEKAVRIVPSTEELLEGSKIKDGVVYNTLRYYKDTTLNYGGSLLLAVPYNPAENRVCLKSADGKHNLIFLSEEITVEELGVKRGAENENGNGKLFNAAIKKAITKKSKLQHFTLTARDTYFVDEPLNFFDTLDSEGKTYQSVFDFDFSGSVLVTTKEITCVCHFANMQNIKIRLGEVKSDTARYGIMFDSMHRYDWSQYVDIDCDYVRGKEWSLYITNNNTGGWVNEIHLLRGQYASGIFVDCPNATDVLFKTNQLSGFYMSNISCEGATTWFKFRNTHNVQISNTRSLDIADKYIECVETCADFHVTLGRALTSNTLKWSDKTTRFFIYGQFTIPEISTLTNPRIISGKMTANGFPLYTNNPNTIPDFWGDKIYLKGESTFQLPSIYGDYGGVDKILFSISGNATGVITDAWGNTVLNVTNHAGKYTMCFIVGSTWEFYDLT